MVSSELASLEQRAGALSEKLLLDIVAVGADLEWLPSGAGMPSLVIGEVALSGS